MTRNGYRDNFFNRYGRWIGLVRKQPVTGPNTGEIVPRFRYCGEPKVPTYSGILQGDFGCSTAFKTKVSNRLPQALSATGIMMFWVMIVMVPCSLLIGVLAGMREGSRLDRILSVRSIASTATPEYVSGIIFSVIFATWLGLLNGSAATATSQGISFYNFTLPVITLAVYGVGYIARMTRASMAEVMPAQCIRTARLKGLSFSSVMLKHALRNALIAPFTVIMLQFPWLLSGVVVVEAIFRYRGFGFLLVQAASNNDIDMVLACGIASGLIFRIWPVWLAHVVLLGLSFALKPKLGLYGHLIGSSVGLAGVIICAFWVFTALLAGIVATGSLPDGKAFQRAMPEHDALPGIERGHAVSAEDVMARAARPGQRVIVLDETANWKGAGTALTLAEAGHRVTIVTGAPMIMMEMARTSTDMQMRSRLRELGVRLLPDSIVLEWHGDGATVQSYGGMPELIAADTLVTAATNISERSLGDDLNAPTIGDATAARNAAMGIHEGRKLAMGL